MCRVLSGLQLVLCVSFHPCCLCHQEYPSCSFSEKSALLWSQEMFPKPQAFIPKLGCTCPGKDNYVLTATW